MQLINPPNAPKVLSVVCSNVGIQLCSCIHTYMHTYIDIYKLFLTVSYSENLYTFLLYCLITVCVTYISVLLAIH